MLRVISSSIDFFKKLFLVVVVFFIIFAVFGNIISKNRPVINDEAIIAAQQKKTYKILEDKKLTSTRMGKVTLATYRFIYCSFIGELCTDKPVADESYFKSSILGQVSSLIVLPYLNPPASGVYWVTNTLQNAGFIPQTYAAEGIGFASIKPLMNLWIIFRDISYLLIVLILVAIGFMIMFRMKLNPQTVISVENALPKIVVALLLITFSFAIAGFLIDLMYLLILLSINVLSSGDKYYSTVKVQNELLNGDIWVLWRYVLPYKDNAWTVPFARELYLGDALGSLLPHWINNLIRILVPGIMSIWVGTNLVTAKGAEGSSSFLNGINLFGNGLGNVPQLFIGAFVSIIIYAITFGIMLNGVGMILGIIVLLTVTGMFFKVFFMLLRSYLQIMISIILAPIILMFEAVPGKGTFSYWLKSLIGELITFPLVIVIFLIGRVLTTTLSYPGDYWRAPFLGSLNTEGFGVVVGAGLIFLIPDLVKFVKDAIGAKPLPFNIGVGTFLGGAGAVAGGGMGILQQFSTLNMGLAAFGKDGFISKLRGDAQKAGQVPARKPNPPPVGTSGTSVTDQET